MTIEKEHLLLYTFLYTSENKVVTARFYNDGTYRCDHWHLHSFWNWKIESNVLYWQAGDLSAEGIAHNRSYNWLEWDMAGDLVRVLEAEAIIKDIIET